MVIEQSNICNFAEQKLRKIWFLIQKSILNWFRLNSLKANHGKFEVEASDDVLLLAITINKKLFFK